jgi:hypothetical protein
MYRTLLPTLLALVMTACATPPEGARPPGRLVLQSPVTIPAGAATLRLQYGKPTAFNAVQEQDPFCVFELDTVSEQPQAVAPASFDILAIQRTVETFSGMPVFPFGVMMVGMGQSSGPIQYYHKTLFRLAPNPQGARTLTCMSNQYMAGIMRHLTLKEMREALGSLFILDLNGPT